VNQNDYKLGLIEIIYFAVACWVNEHSCMDIRRRTYSKLVSKWTLFNILKPVAMLSIHSTVPATFDIAAPDDKMTVLGQTGYTEVHIYIKTSFNC